MNRVLGETLQQAVRERLDMLDELVGNADNESLLSLARSELPRLTHGWQVLLATHSSDPRGRCPECSTRWRPRAAPCTVWRAAHEHLVSTDPEDSKAASRMRPPASLLPGRVAAEAGIAR